MPTPKLTQEIILAAIEGFESQKRRIDAQIAELRQTLEGGSAESATVPAPPERKRKISAAGLARIADAQRKRWAAKKAAEQTEPGIASKAAKPKRKLSAAGREAIIEATKKRWARIRGEAATAAKTKRVPAKRAAKKAAGKKKAAPKAAKKAPTPPAKTAAPASRD